MGTQLAERSALIGAAFVHLSPASHTRSVDVKNPAEHQLPRVAGAVATPDMSYDWPVKMLIEKFGTVGAVMGALACPICFPKLALIGAAVGLGAFSPFERYTAVVVQGLFAVAFLGQVIAYPRHRNKWLLGFSALTTLTLFTGYYVIRSSTLLQIALGGLLAASVWHVVEMRRCAKCGATTDENQRSRPVAQHS